MLYYHYRELPNAVTIAGEFCGDQLCLAAARKSKKDNFDKKKGRLIATGRFNTGKVCMKIPVTVVDPKERNQFFILEAKKLAEKISINPKNLVQV